jgi:hypothetical protein
MELSMRTARTAFDERIPASPPSPPRYLVKANEVKKKRGGHPAEANP